MTLQSAEERRWKRRGDQAEAGRILVVGNGDGRGVRQEQSLAHLRVQQVQMAVGVPGGKEPSGGGKGPAK